MPLHELLEALGHLGVELPDVGAVELHNVDVDQRNILPVLPHRVAGGTAEILEIGWNGSDSQSTIEGELGVEMAWKY